MVSWGQDSRSCHRWSNGSSWLTKSAKCWVVFLLKQDGTIMPWTRILASGLVRQRIRHAYWLYCPVATALCNGDVPR